MVRRLISLPEAAGTPEGGKVLGRGSAPMDAVLSIGPYDAERAAGVEFAQVYRCFVPVQETQKTQGELFATLLQLRAAAARAVMGEREASRSH